MADAKHTPGPWRPQDYVKGDSSVGVGSNVAETDNKNGGYWVARCLGPDKLANARLIAAAPELLEAIGPLLEAHIRLYGKIDPTTSSAGEEQQRAIAAIAKATGAA